MKNLSLETVLAWCVLFATVTPVSAAKEREDAGLLLDCGFEKPAVKKDTGDMIPSDFTVGFAVGDQSPSRYGLTRAKSHMGKQSLFLDLGYDRQATGYGVSGIIREFPVNGLAIGQRFLLEAWMASDAVHPVLGGAATIRIEFYGPSASTLIYRTDDDSRHERDTLDAGNSATEFVRFFVDCEITTDIIPDPSAVRVVKVVVGGNTEQNSGSGRVFVDDVVLKEVTAGPAPGQ